jgi:hypothetical protein
MCRGYLRDLDRDDIASNSVHGVSALHFSTDLLFIEHVLLAYVSFMLSFMVFVFFFQRRYVAFLF